MSTKTGRLAFIDAPHGMIMTMPPHDERTAFARWLVLFLRAARGETLEVPINRAAYPPLIAQRRMLQRLALTYASGSWPLGALPPHAAADSLERPFGLGNPLAPVLLVGDRPQPGAARWAERHGWPFISGLRSGCSSWLAEQLEEWDVPENDLQWFNARLGDGTPDVATLGYVKKRWQDGAQVIALGGNAARALTDVRTMQFEEVHHPQYWKRFHHGQQYVLPRIIKNLQRRVV